LRPRSGQGPGAGACAGRRGAGDQNVLNGAMRSQHRCPGGACGAPRLETREALNDLAAGRPVATPASRPFGCTIANRG